ncbi:hypothetical protein GGI07_003087 [Coemansia sp. Benny D115]|nr:hypothetical protein GGI07_003087 [Coemansia sp. Benny D115]
MINIPYLTSCNHCREKKRKCDGKRPVCSLCRSHNVPCEYRRSRRFRKRTQDADAIPIQNIMPDTGRQQKLSGAPAYFADSTASSGGHPSTPLGTSSSSMGGLSVFVPQTTGGSQGPQIPAATLSTEVSALSQLLAGDMYPLTQQLPQPILQNVNNFMSPFSNPRTQTIPEWVSQQKPGAAIISNLESLANAYQETPLVPMQSMASPDGILFGNLTSQIMYGGNMLQTPFQNGATPFHQSGPRQPRVAQVTGLPGSHAPGSFALSNMLTPVTSTISPATASGAPVSGQSAAVQPMAFSDATAAAFNYAVGGMGGMGSARRSSSLMSGSQGSDIHRLASPSGSSTHRTYGPYGAVRSPSTGALSDISVTMGGSGGSGSGMYPSIPDADAGGELRGFNSASAGPASAAVSSAHTAGQPNGTVNHRSGANGARHPSNAMYPPPSRLPPPPLSQSLSQSNGVDAKYPDGFVPEIIQIYAREFPADLSPDVLLKVMRGIYSSTRTSLVNIDIELSWCMILKGIIPRILLFAYIASMARGQVVDPELVPQLPAKFDEICYEYATRDIPLALASPSLWSALSLYLLGRYEFQSARYDLMQQHYEMAAEILTKTTFHGYAFPWNGVPDALKRTFEHDYYVYTFWVGFQWHLVSCFNLDRPFNLNIDPESLPMPASNSGYFSPKLPCEFDLLTLLPANSWPRSAQTESLTQVWFRGFGDPEYSGWRPAEWKKITPNYRITAYLQRMLPLGAQLYRMQCEFSEGKLSLASYLQQLQAKQELLRRWHYSLPREFEITQEKVSRLTRATFSQSTTSEDANLIMDFKELVMTYGLYNTFLIRANRVALVGMLGESLAAPATSMHTRVFGLRDYYEAMEQSLGSVDFGAEEYGDWKKNQAFHKCRMQCYESIGILCNVVQLSFMLRLNLFSYGTTYVAIAGEVLNVLVGKLGIKDKPTMWKTKTQLGHVLCLLRSLQHWLPAIYMFVYGIQALSDPSLVLEVDDVKMKEITKKQKQDEQQHIGGLLGASSSSSSSKADIGMAKSANGHDRNGDGSVAHISNPFPPNHIINLIVDDLDSSLATFLAPAYPMLLLKIFANKM